MTRKSQIGLGSKQLHRIDACTRAGKPPGDKSRGAAQGRQARTVDGATFGALGATLVHDRQRPASPSGLVIQAEPFFCGRFARREGGNAKHIRE